jgi:hypothetical protein
MSHQKDAFFKKIWVKSVESKARSPSAKEKGYETIKKYQGKHCVSNGIF